LNKFMEFKNILYFILVVAIISVFISFSGNLSLFVVLLLILILFFLLFTMKLLISHSAKETEKMDKLAVVQSNTNFKNLMIGLFYSFLIIPCAGFLGILITPSWINNSSSVESFFNSIFITGFFTVVLFLILNSIALIILRNKRYIGGIAFGYLWIILIIIIYSIMLMGAGIVYGFRT